MVFDLNYYTFPLEQRTVSLARCKQLRKCVSGDGGDGGDGLDQD